MDRIIGCHQSGTEIGTCQISAATDQTKGQSAEMENTVGAPRRGDAATLGAGSQPSKFERNAVMTFFDPKFTRVVFCFMVSIANGCHNQKTCNQKGCTGLG